MKCKYLLCVFRLISEVEVQMVNTRIQLIKSLLIYLNKMLKNISANRNIPSENNHIVNNDFCGETESLVRI